MADTQGKRLDYKLGPVDVTWEDQGDGTWAERIISRNIVWDPVGLSWVRAKQSVLSTDTLSVTIPTPTPVTDNGGSLTVDGAVSVSNFPAVQPVSDNAGSLTQETVNLSLVHF